MSTHRASESFAARAHPVCTTCREPWPCTATRAARAAAPRCGHQQTTATGTWVCISPPHHWPRDKGGHVAAAKRAHGLVVTPDRHVFVKAPADA